MTNSDRRKLKTVNLKDQYVMTMKGLSIDLYQTHLLSSTVKDLGVSFVDKMESMHLQMSCFFNISEAFRLLKRFLCCVVFRKRLSNAKKLVHL